MKVSCWSWLSLASTSSWACVAGAVHHVARPATASGVSLRARTTTRTSSSGGAQVAAGNDFALADEDDLVAGDFDLAEQMGIEENGGAAFALRANDIAHQAAAHGIESGSGLVEKNQFRLVDQGLRQADALQHALGEILQALVAVRREADQVDQRRHTVAQGGGGHAGEAAMQMEEFGGREPFVEAKILGKKTDFAAYLDIARRARRAQKPGRRWAAPSPAAF